jgi:hypothetical protein
VARGSGADFDQLDDDVDVEDDELVAEPPCSK